MTMMIKNLVDKDKLRTKQVLVHGTLIDMGTVVGTYDLIDFNIRKGIRKMKNTKRKYKR